MATIRKFEDLEIWQEARRLSIEIIGIAKSTELKTDFKLRDRIKDSSDSFIDTISEEFERGGDLEFR